MFNTTGKQRVEEIHVLLFKNKNQVKIVLMSEATAKF